MGHMMEREYLIERYPEVKNTFVISSVKDATDERNEIFKEYKSSLVEKGINVHLPFEDTNQKNTGLLICSQNRGAVEWSDVVSIFYDIASKGSHFDLGMTLANYKPLFVAQYFSQDGEFADMLREWEGKSLEDIVLKGEKEQVQQDSVFLIADVDENTSQKEISTIRAYVERLERNGVSVYWPFRDAPEGVSKLEEVFVYRKEMERAENVHLFLEKTNNTFFQMGLAFGNYKPLTVVKNVEYGPNKSLPRMADEWAGNI